MIYLRLIYVIVNNFSEICMPRYLISLDTGTGLLPIQQRFSTCGPRTTGGPRQSAWWSSSKA